MTTEVVAVQPDEDAAPGVETFDEFARRLHPRLVAAVELYCGDLAVAEDAAQEALIKALMRWERVSSTSAPDAYVMRMAMNAATAWYRRLKVGQRAVTRHAREQHVQSQEPTEALALRSALSQLPSRQRQAVVLRYLGGFSVAETAAAMRCAEGTVRALTSQAISSLRRDLDTELEEGAHAE